MTDFIENIEQGVRYTDCELENTAILLNIDCPICGKHDVYAKSYVVNNPVLVEDTTVCTAVIGCAFCSEQMTYYVDPDLPMKDYKEFINQIMVYNWLDAVSKDPNIHAWKRDRLFDVANGKEPLEFWEHALDARLRSSMNRHRKALDMLAEGEE